MIHRDDLIAQMSIQATRESQSLTSWSLVYSDLGRLRTRKVGLDLLTAKNALSMPALAREHPSRKGHHIQAFRNRAALEEGDRGSVASSISLIRPNFKSLPSKSKNPILRTLAPRYIHLDRHFLRIPALSNFTADPDFTS